MRFIYAVMMLLMVLFVAVQYNDPDGWLWAAIYALPAFWCFFAMLAPDRLTAGIWRLILGVSMLGALAAMIWFWPDTPRFWTMPVWYESETAREGLGMMVVLVVLCTVYFGTRRKAPELVPEPEASG